MDAQWTPNKVKLAYHPNGGTATKAELNDYGFLKYNGETYFQTINHGSKADPYNASTLGLTRNGYKFAGWEVKSKAYIKQTGLVFMLKSLNNFANNGRVSPLVARIAGFAGICIVGKASDEGTLEPTHKCRGEARSIETIIKDLSAMGLKNGKVSIAHCQNEEGALKLKNLIAEKFKNAQVEIHKLRGLCSFYAEKGGFLVGFEKM